MRKFTYVAAGAVLALAGWSAGTQTQAITLTIGGLAGACSSAAKAGEFDQHALDLCTMAIASEPLNPHDLAGTHVNRGAMELLARDHEAAHADFVEALRIDPNMGEAHIGEGAYLVSQERWADAEAEITRGLSLGSEEPEKGYYFRGLARWGQENFKGAYFDFKKALELKPGWNLPKEQLANFKVTPAG